MFTKIIWKNKYFELNVMFLFCRIMCAGSMKVLHQRTLPMSLDAEGLKFWIFGGSFNDMPYIFHLVFVLIHTLVTVSVFVINYEYF